MENVADALDELRRRGEATPGAGEEHGDAGDAPDLATQREILVEWAREKSLALEAEAWLSRREQTHGERHVFFDPDKQRYFKITHDAVNETVAGFAVTVDLDDIRMSRHSERWMCVPRLRGATPLEYLSRLVVFNRTFGDDIQIEGVICDPGQAAIVTSQPVIRGQPASYEEVRTFMEEMGFVWSDCPPLGRKNVVSLSFFHPEEHIAVFDIHAANFPERVMHFRGQDSTVRCSVASLRRWRGASNRLGEPTLQRVRQRNAASKCMTRSSQRGHRRPHRRAHRSPA